MEDELSGSSESARLWNLRLRSITLAGCVVLGNDWQSGARVPVPGVVYAWDRVERPQLVESPAHVCLTEIAVREPSVRDCEGVVVRSRESSKSGACERGLSVLLFLDPDCAARRRGARSSDGASARQLVIGHRGFTEVRVKGGERCHCIIFLTSRKRCRILQSRIREGVDCVAP